MTISTTPLLLAALAMLAPIAAHSATEASDDFQSGDLLGGSGDWIGEWTTQGNTITPAVVAGVLDVDRSAGGANNTAAVRRQYSANLTDSVTISFDYTIDQLPTAGGLPRQDRFEIFGGIPTTGSNGANTWLILGGLDLTGLEAHLTDGSWALHDGQGDANFNNGEAGENSLVSSGIPLVEGHTYRFTITDLPATAQYTVTIDDLDTAAPPFNSAMLGYRGAAVEDPRISFGCRLSDAGDTSQFSVDDVVLSSSEAGDVPLEIIDIQYVDDGAGGDITVRVTWRSVPQRCYAIYWSTDLIDWSNELSDSELATENTKSYFDTTVPDATTSRFYRVEEL